jgi:pimeloyl-ACP methyl ester carboxylesterase
MSSLFAKLGARIDTWRGSRKMEQFRLGWPSSTSENVKFYRTAKVQYRYRETGAGDTIIFTVDPPTTLEVYDRLIEAFSKHFRVIAVELPAMGYSAALESYQFGFQETNDDLISFIQSVCGLRNILAFSCVSGLAAIDIAHRTPELVSELCLIQSGGVEAFEKWKHARDPKRVLGRPVLGQFAMKKMALKRIPQWYKISVGRKEQMEYFCTCAKHSFEHGAMWSLASAYQLYMNLSDELPQPTQPILSIWGGADKSHPPMNAHSLDILYEDVSCVTFDDLGHTPELEDPMRVLSAILKFRELQ